MRIETVSRRIILIAALCLSPALAFADSHNSNPDQTATIWGVFINNPSACASVPCAEADIFADDNAAETDVCYVTGARTPARGRATFGGRFAEGSNFGCIYSGLGLKDAENAEVHFVAQRHDRPKKDMLADQVTEFLGGCTEEGNNCLDVHFAIHLADGQHESVSNMYRFRDASMIVNASSVLRRYADGIKVAVNTKFWPARDTY